METLEQSIEHIGQILDHNKIVNDGFALIVDVYNEYKKNKKNREFHTIYSFNRENANIRLSLPRKKGNSTLLMKLFRYFSNSIIIEPGITNLKYLSKEEKHRFSNIDNAKNTKGKIVLIDETSYKNDEYIKKVLQLDAEFFIFLG